MAGEDMGVPQPPAVARAGTWSRHVAPQGQRESGKENARTTSEAPLATKMCSQVRFTYPALAGLAVCSLAVFLWHRWSYTLRGWFGLQLASEGKGRERTEP